MAKRDSGENDASLRIDPAGHVHTCTKRISPEGHRPVAYCNMNVFWMTRRPLGWTTHRADRFDHSVEHRCREWTIEEDARIRKSLEETAESRYGTGLSSLIDAAGPKGLRAEVDCDLTVADLEETASQLPQVEVFSPTERRRRERKDARQERREKREARAAEKAPVMRNGEAADADWRRARKPHQCSSCSAEIPGGSKYLESRDGANAFTPDRFCGQCAGSMGYSSPE